MSPVASQDPTKQAIWEIESTNPDLVEPVEKALRQVVDPEIGLNVVELGLVRNVKLENEDKAQVTMIMTTPFCPYAPALLEMTRTKAAEALKLTPEDLRQLGLIDEIVPEPAGGAHNDPAAMAQTLARVLQSQLRKIESLPPDRMIQQRYEKFRAMGAFGE